MQIHYIFEEQVRSNPDSIAVINGEKHVTYEQLNVHANRLANHIRSVGFPAGSVLAFLLDNSVNTLVSLLGILKSGHAFLPIEPTLPFERQKYMLNDAGAVLLITQQRLLGRSSKLLWECASLRELISLDSDLEGLAEDEENQLMNPELWDYFGSNATDQITYGGWVSSYTGLPFSAQEMDEYGKNAKAKLLPYLNEEARVLEIGCSSGITMFEIAPHVSEYYGIDISEEILKYTRQEIDKVGWDHVKLLKLGAHQLNDLAVRDFDIVIINSVVQSFEGYRYFKKVLRDILRLVRDEAVVFFGDIQDQDLKSDMEKDLLAYKNSQAEATQVKLDWSQELFLSRAFFFDLMCDFPEVSSVDPSDKEGTIANELTRFRFDVILRVDKSVTAKTTDRKRLKTETGASALEISSETNPDILLNKDDLAYVLYTSGSTGMPKGVEISNKNISNYICWANDYYFKNDLEGNMAFVTSVSFDLTLTSLFSPLCRGRYVYIPSGEHFDERIEDCLLNSEVDTIKLTPTHLSMIHEDLNFNIRKVILGGEPVRKSHFQKLKRLNPVITVYNEYGPTETTVGSAVAEIDEEYLGIGKPIANTYVFILDRALQIVALDNVGEICIAGDGVAKGYRNQKELTATSFVQNPYGEGKLYRTGDFGKWNEEGQLVLSGRKDTQVKVRGYRLEVEEVEKTIRQYPGIENVVVRWIPRNDEEGILTAYYVSADADAVPAETDLMTFLRNRLPAQSLPDFVVPVGDIPLTASGKTDLKALPDPEKTSSDRTGESPQGEMERKLAEIWGKILVRDFIGRTENFFSLNGHSLKAMQMVALIEKELNIKIKLKTIFTYPTIKDLAEELWKLDTETFLQIERVPVSKSYEVSHAQKRFWLADQLEGFSKDDHPYTRFYVQEALNLPIFEKAVQALIERHETLRTLFIVEEGELRQVVKKAGEVNFQIAYSELNREGDVTTQLEAIEIKDKHWKFNLESGPLLKMRIVKIGYEKFMILYAIHHILTDGISMQIFARELKTLYEAFKRHEPDPLAPLRLQYKDYAVWHNRKLQSRATLESRAYWRQQLSGQLPRLYFQSKMNDSTIEGRGGQVYYVNIDEELTREIVSLGQKFQTTTFIVLQACLRILLYRNTSQTDLIIGTPISGRVHADLEHQIGLFLNTLPLRAEISSRDSFTEVLTTVRETTLEAYQHEDYPFDFIISDEQIKKAPDQNMLFDVGFTYHSHLENEKVSYSESEGTGEAEVYNLQSSYPLWFVAMRHQAGLGFMVHYSSSLFDESEVREWMGQLKKIMQQIIANSAVSVGEIVLEKKSDNNCRRVSINLDL